jgi:hypothetical protein
LINKQNILNKIIYLIKENKKYTVNRNEHLFDFSFTKKFKTSFEKYVFPGSCYKFLKIPFSNLEKYYYFIFQILIIISIDFYWIKKDIIFKTYEQL